MALLSNPTFLLLALILGPSSGGLVAGLVGGSTAADDHETLIKIEAAMDSLHEKVDNLKDSGAALRGDVEDLEDRIEDLEALHRDELRRR